MESELREALEKHLFNYKWGDPDGGGSKIFPAYDIRCADFHHNDFTLRASNLKEAILMIDRGNFAISFLIGWKVSKSSILPPPPLPGLQVIILITLL